VSAPRGDIEIEVFTESLDDRYTIQPNELLRAEDVFSGLSLRARGLLGALLSMKRAAGWKTSRAGIRKLCAGLGDAAIDTVIRELKHRRHLRTIRTNGGDGKFVWRWQVFMYPYPQPVDAESAGQAIPRNSPHGPDSDYADNGDDTIPLQTMGGSSMDGSPTPYRSKKDLEVTEDQEQPPPPPRDTANADVVARPARTGAGNPPPLDLDNPTVGQAAELLAELLGAVPAARRPSGRHHAELVVLLTRHITAGWPPRQLAVALSGDLRGAGSVWRVLRARLADLDTPPPAEPARGASGAADGGADRGQCTVPGCDRLAGGSGHVEIPDGTRQDGVLLVPCPDCKPAAFERVAARGVVKLIEQAGPDGPVRTVALATGKRAPRAAPTSGRGATS
jgi:hypothetical protein